MRTDESLWVVVVNVSVCRLSAVDVDVALRFLRVARRSWPESSNVQGCCDARWRRYPQFIYKCGLNHFSQCVSRASDVGKYTHTIDVHTDSHQHTHLRTKRHHIYSRKPHHRRRKRTSAPHYHRTRDTMATTAITHLQKHTYTHHSGKHACSIYTYTTLTYSVY